MTACDEREISSLEARRGPQFFVAAKLNLKQCNGMKYYVVWLVVLCFSAQLYSIIRYGILRQSIGYNANRRRERDLFPIFNMKNYTRQIINIPIVTSSISHVKQLQFLCNLSLNDLY